MANLKVGIVGGGAAGFFAAINLKELFEGEIDVTILEASDKVLSKVRVSGGGRCNLTNTFEGIGSLSKVYPRGEKIMRRALSTFGWRETFDWFEEHGVELITQEDETVFPRSQSSEEIIKMFGYFSRREGVEILTSHRVANIKRCDNEFEVECSKGDKLLFDIVIVTTGGSPSQGGYNFLHSLPINLKRPLPSLYTLNIADGALTDLMGVVIPNAMVGVASTKHRGDGALLITHWGVSGPATLKLSSYAAEYLSDRGYCAPIFINWVGERDEQAVMREVRAVVASDSKKLVTSARPYSSTISTRVWQHILKRGGIDPTRRWGDMSLKSLNTIVRVLTNDLYSSCGRAKHKEEFVTCGGVDLSSVNPLTLEAIECKGLYFAGEVLDIDAITGGFNLQAAWSTAHAVACAIYEL